MRVRVLSELVRPLPGGMNHSEDFDAAVADAVGQDIGRSSEDEFAGPIAPARPPDFRVADEHRGSLLDQIDQCCRSGSAIPRDERKYLIEFA